MLGLNELWDRAPDVVSRVLFPTPESSYDVDDFPEELIWIPRSLEPDSSTPEDHVPCLLLLSPSARYVMLYLHSNAEDLGQCYDFCCVLRSQFQVNVLAVEYPGYGVCPGEQACEDTVIANAFTAFNFLRKVLNWSPDEIIIFGRSIGCGPALALAEKTLVYGVILVCPFLSVKEIAAVHIGPVLASMIVERFPNKDRIPLVKSRVLVIHGKKDSVVPVWHGQELFRRCVARKHFVCPDKMEHNTNLLSDATHFVLPALQFFSLPDYTFDQIRVPPWVYDKRAAVDRGAARGAKNAMKRAEKASPSVATSFSSPTTVSASPSRVPPDAGAIAMLHAPANGGSAPTSPRQPAQPEDDLDQVDFDEADDEPPAPPEDVGYWKAPPSNPGVPPLLRRGIAV